MSSASKHKQLSKLRLSHLTMP